MRRQRFDRARAVVAAGLVQVLGADDQGRAVKLAVPCGSTVGAWHVVELRFSQRSDHWEIQFGCAERTNREATLCLGNSHTACYHGLAAFIHRQGILGNEVRFCETQETAKRLARMGGLAMHLVGRANGSRKGLWTVVRPKRKGGKS